MAWLTVIDTNANGRESNRFTLPVLGPSTSVEALLRRRIVVDLERVEADHPERHVPLVQPLRTREHDDEIELFTPPMVDVEAQVQAALAGFAAGDFALMVDGETVDGVDARLSLDRPCELRFVRNALMIGG